MESKPRLHKKRRRDFSPQFAVVSEGRIMMKFVR